MPEAKRPWRNMLHDIVQAAIKGAEKSPTLAHCISNTPPFLFMLGQSIFDPSLELDWTAWVGAGLFSKNNNAFNVAMYHYCQNNEIADAEAKVLAGYAELVRGVADILPNVGEMYQARVKESEITKRKALK